MKCPVKKEWVLFYYQEKPRGQQEWLAQHLASCSTCRSLYEGVCASLRSVDTKQPVLNTEELNDVIAAARVRAHRPAREFFRADIMRVLDSFLQGFFAKPQFALAGLVLLITLSLVSLRVQRLHWRMQENIIDVEAELAFEDDSNNAIDEGADIMVDEFTAWPHRAGVFA